MAITVHIYLDKRAVKQGCEAPLKIGINRHSSSAYISLGKKILPSQWDAKKERIKNRADKNLLQSYIDHQKNVVSNLVLDLTKKGELTQLTATQIKNKIISILDPAPKPKNSFFSRFISYADSRQAIRTREIYHVTARKMKQYDPNVESKSFEEITKDWLLGFDTFLKLRTPALNARSVYFRNIRAVFRDAIDNEITTFYPFRIFKIKTEQTQKRSLTIRELCTLFSFKGNKWQAWAIDMFKLSLFLIGINISDLSNLQEISPDGRIYYKRAKTGKLYSVKIEPEALEIIKKHKGKSHLLDILDRYSTVNTFAMALSTHLQSIPSFESLTSYWARHTWATLASELDIPVDVISHALGHSFSTGAKVTQVYIDFNMSKVDKANRKVIDYIIQSCSSQ